MKIVVTTTVLLLVGSKRTASAHTATPNLTPIAARPFKADRNSLTNDHTPGWFRDAKFGN